MQTETKTITQLPIMKYFDDAKLVEKGKETLGKWRKGEKPIGAIIGLILIGIIGYGTIQMDNSGSFWCPKSGFCCYCLSSGSYSCYIAFTCYFQAFPQNCPFVSQSYHPLESFR